MEKQTLKSSILVNAIVLLTVAVLTVSVSFAWFFFILPEEKHQHFTIGSFEVHLDDDSAATDGYAGATAVKIANAYPMTRDQVLNKVFPTTGEGDYSYLYTARVRNAGQVDAMFRFALTNLTVTNTNGSAELARYIRCAVRVTREESALKTLTADTPFTTDAVYLSGAEAIGEAPKKTGLIEFLDGYLLKDAQYTESLPGGTTAERTGKRIKDGSTDSTGVTEPDYRILKNVPGGTNTAIYVQILFWMDENTTVEQAGANYNDPLKMPSLSFRLDLHAMQAGGGAYWEEGWTPSAAP